MSRRASSPRPSQQRDRWTTSYADFVTILLTLFVAIAAQGTQAPASLVTPPRPKPGESAPAVAPEFQKLEGQGIRLKMERRGLIISLEQKVLFRSGDDRISKEAWPVVSEIARILARIPNHVNLIGHADARPVSGKRFRDNWELSVARSLRLRELLTEEFGIDESRLSVASLGSMDPLSRNSTAEALANDRRVEILILDQPARQ